MERPYRVVETVSILPSSVPIPGLGMLPVNAYLLQSRQPLLVDTGLHADTDEFLAALRSLIDPGDLRWIWLTHIDQDHVGSLARLLEEAPRAKVITSFLGAGKCALFAPLPPERMHWLNPGQSIDLGDRVLTAVRPPVYDAPETTGAYDSRSKVFFSSDCFGAILPGMVHDASRIPAGLLRERQIQWATIDAPWLHDVGEGRLASALAGIRRMAPTAILGSHLPPVFGAIEPMLDALACARTGAPFVAPDQAVRDAMMVENAIAAAGPASAQGQGVEGAPGERASAADAPVRIAADFEAMRQ